MSGVLCVSPDESCQTRQTEAEQGAGRNLGMAEQPQQLLLQVVGA
jgi:hypothetical protein